MSWQPGPSIIHYGCITALLSAHIELHRSFLSDQLLVLSWVAGSVSAGENRLLPMAEVALGDSGEQRSSLWVPDGLHVQTM